MTKTYPKPKLLIFKEALLGDLLKFQNQANISDTGGGARDLRFRTSVQGELKNVLDEMFDESIGDTRMKRKVVKWFKNEKVNETEVEYWQPTAARPKELRIARISRIEGWEISREVFDEVTRSGHFLFYLLILDEQGSLWARTFNSQRIDPTKMDQAFIRKIEEVINSRYKVTKQGYVRFS